MKIAVLGGGTAGTIAATHISHDFPEADLLQIRDRSIPSIGVGEGTNPRFTQWLESVTGLHFSDLQKSCHATLKIGTRFEGWGTQCSSFLNRFQPSHLVGLHLDAGLLATLLEQYSSAQQLHAHVMSLKSDSEGVEVIISGQDSLQVDYVIDARGFPANHNDDLEDNDISHPISWIPTNSARLYRLFPARSSNVTRAIARPHGWIFCIPLRGWTSCGYIYNNRISSPEEIEEDFANFIKYEETDKYEYRGSRTFPNHIRNNIFDGRVFWVGNAAGFLEPLEATAISTAIVQIRKASTWIKRKLPCGSGCATEYEIRAYNHAVRSASLRDSLFLAWHYACGSRWQTPFWSYAMNCYFSSQILHDGASDLTSMQTFIEAGRNLSPSMLTKSHSREAWAANVLPHLKVYQPFGTFSELNFSQVGHGIGYY